MLLNYVINQNVYLKGLMSDDDNMLLSKAHILNLIT